jgi:hypothetical protein
MTSPVKRKSYCGDQYIEYACHSLNWRVGNCAVPPEIVMSGKMTLPPQPIHRKVMASSVIRSGRLCGGVMLCARIHPQPSLLITWTRYGLSGELATRHGLRIHFSTMPTTRTSAGEMLGYRHEKVRRRRPSAHGPGLARSS